jgi:hypothetical protein
MERGVELKLLGNIKMFGRTSKSLASLEAWEPAVFIGVVSRQNTKHLPISCSGWKAQDI